MNTTAPSPSTALPETGRRFPALLALFVGSGCAALIYEIVWFQLLQLVIGSSADSLGVLLGTFMGGMCLGSLLAPRLVSAGRHPLRVYAVLELGIGVIGLLILVAMPYVDHVYITGVGHGQGSIRLRGLVCAVLLLPPTVLMGATLPVMARWVETSARGVSWLGLFYGGNIAGAVFGCLLAGFYLLRIHDLTIATFVAAGINLAVATVALVLAGRGPWRAPAAIASADLSPQTSGAWCVYVGIGLSGLCALGAEVVWTRLLSLMLGATVYTFSLILAVFLVGLGIGSSLGAMLCRRAGARVVLGTCQFLLAAAVAWSAYMMAVCLPYWPIQPSLAHSPWLHLQVDISRCVWAVLPAALLWGASFPAAVASLAWRGKDLGRVVGGIYAANTVGAIIGSLAFSLLVIPHMGTHQAQRLLIGLSALSALIVLMPLLRQTSSAPTSPAGRPRRRIAPLASLLVSAAICAVLAWRIPPVPWGLIAYGRLLPMTPWPATLVYIGEGMNSSVAVTDTGGERYFHVSGKIEASSEWQDMRLQRMLGHIPALIHGKPRSVLVVGCGAGVTAGSFVVHPSVERIVICEIEPLIPQVVARHFAYENHAVLKDPRVQVIYDDARHYVLTTHDRFDIITSDPIHPWVKGAATLYTREYFEMCKEHLNPGGVVTQWVPLYESNMEAVKSEMRTFFEVFPNGTIWSNDKNGKGYDLVLLGQVESTQIPVDFLQERLARRDHKDAADSLADVGFDSVPELLATYAGRGGDLEPWLRYAEVNRDRNLRLQYLAGMGLDADQSEQIHDEILTYRRFSEELFVASDSVRQALKMEMAKSSLRRAAR